MLNVTSTLSSMPQNPSPPRARGSPSNKNASTSKGDAAPNGTSCDTAINLLPQRIPQTSEQKRSRSPPKTKASRRHKFEAVPSSDGQRTQPNVVEIAPESIARESSASSAAGRAHTANKPHISANTKRSWRSVRCRDMINAVSRGDVTKNPCSVSSTDSLGSSPRNSRCLMLAGQVRLFLVRTNVYNGKPSATAAVGLRARSYRCRSSSGRGSGGHKART